MERFEHTEHGKPEISPEESGVRRISKSTKEEEKEMFRKMAAKAEEVHPDDPWEEFGPKDEPDTAKVWGTEDLSEEDRLERAARIAETQRILDQLKKEESDEERKAS